MKNPGFIAKMTDGRNVIIYTKQPLLKEKGKIVVHLVDDSFMGLKNEEGQPKTLLFNIEVYNKLIKTWKAVGFVD